MSHHQSARLLVFGAGYSGAAVAGAAMAAGFAVSATRRHATAGPPGVSMVPFTDAGAAIAAATHVLVTAPPDASGDPVLEAYGDTVAAAAHLRWIGYLSTTGVYGDRGGGWVDETTAPAPGTARAVRRVEAEQGWAAMGARVAVDLFRVAGIYGPGRSAFDDLRAGRARRVDKPGHAFGRIHRDDIAGVVVAAMRQQWPAAMRQQWPAAMRQQWPAAMRQQRSAGVRVLHLADDVPAESAAVVAEAARLLGVPAPGLVPFAEAIRTMSAMAQSFWAENRRVASAQTQAALGYRWRYPDFRAGLAAILAEEGRDGSPE